MAGRSLSLAEGSTSTSGTAAVIGRVASNGSGWLSEPAEPWAAGALNWNTDPGSAAQPGSVLAGSLLAGSLLADSVLAVAAGAGGTGGGAGVEGSAGGGALRVNTDSAGPSGSAVRIDAALSLECLPTVAGRPEPDGLSGSALPEGLGLANQLAAAGGPTGSLAAASGTNVPDGLGAVLFRGMAWGDDSPDPSAVLAPYAP